MLFLSKSYFPLQFGICDLPVIPVRSEPSDKSEMVTQLIFGESFEITEQKNQWLRINTSFDNYVGWIDSKQVQLLSYSDHQKLLQERLCVTTELICTAEHDKTTILLPIGSTIPFSDGKGFSINEKGFLLKGKTSCPDKNEFTEKKVAHYAKLFLGSPYLWGGRTPFGIDCSGFTQIVYKLLGYSLHRDAYQQADEGMMVNFVDHARTGDLAFFHKEDGKITHTGIILPNKKIIHASGRVRIDTIDHYGIFNDETKSYSHQLRVIKRIL